MPRAFLPNVALVLAVTALSLLVPSVASAADSAVGKWEGTVETRRGANEVSLEFSKSGDGLEGTWTGPRGTSDLEEVEHEGANLTFVRNVEMRGNAIALNFTATIDGDTMNVTMETPRGESQFTLSRVK